LGQGTEALGKQETGERKDNGKDEQRIIGTGDGSIWETRDRRKKGQGDMSDRE